MIRRITFASCYVYSPSGSGPAAARSRLLRSLLKAGDAHFMDKYADRVRRQVAEQRDLAEFFGVDSILVPVPGSARSVNGQQSIALHLASALLSEGVGYSVWPGLRRVRSVRKSATAAPGSRPTVGIHYDSFALDPVTITPARQIVLVDDVVTEGRTLLAAATRVQEAFPEARVRAFALLRTLGMTPCLDHLLEPCIGEIRWRAGDAHRTP